MRQIESEYRKKKMLKPMFEAVDKMIEIIGDEEE
jgi:hypothetical protein